MNLTILHISDLHRDPANPISNVSLLDSLERDRDRYRQESPPIGDVDLIIVSGDIIHGIAPDVPNPMEQLAQQYQQAEDFLVQLAGSFVNSDRERVIVVPGNHDVSFYHAIHSMRRLPIDPTDPGAKHSLVVEQFLSGHSRFRWSWKDLCFYKIVNEDLYHARLDAFCAFYDRFYRSQRKYSLEPESQYDIFDYPNFNISVATFSTCYNNDPLNKQAALHPDCLSEACRKIRQGLPRDRLLFAVWHHNTTGGPMQSDYLDAENLQVLIDSGFSIGFHGHQHKPQFIEERLQFGVNRRITIVSAGTLCAGPGALPTGYTRAYNLLQMDTEMFTARLHVRQMLNESFNTSPIWGPGRLSSSMKSFADFEIQRPTQRSSSSVTNAVGEAESLLRNKKPREAAFLLRPLAPESPLARRLLLECYVECDDTRAIVESFYPPTATNEVVYIADALWAEKQYSLLRELVTSDLVQNSLEPAVDEVRRKYEERLRQ